MQPEYALNSSQTQVGARVQLQRASAIARYEARRAFKKGPIFTEIALDQCFGKCMVKGAQDIAYITVALSTMGYLLSCAQVAEGFFQVSQVFLHQGEEIPRSLERRLLGVKRVVLHVDGEAAKFSARWVLDGLGLRGCAFQLLRGDLREWEQRSGILRDGFLGDYSSSELLNAALVDASLGEELLESGRIDAMGLMAIEQSQH